MHQRGARGINPDMGTKIGVVVSDDLVAAVLEVIQTHAHTGRRGDGRIFVIDVQKTVVIHSGEMNES